MKQIGSAGRLYFEYVSEERSRDLADFQDFQLHHRVLGAIGIGLCSTPQKDHDQFVKAIDSFGHCCVSRHFAFEPAEGQSDDNGDIIVIPDQGEDQIRFYMNTMINDFAISLLRQFDHMVHQLMPFYALFWQLEEIGSMPKVPSPRDYDNSLPKESLNRLHIRFAGRKLKLIGDLYLLSGNFSEALSR